MTISNPPSNPYTPDAEIDFDCTINTGGAEGGCKYLQKSLNYTSSNLGLIAIMRVPKGQF